MPRMNLIKGFHPGNLTCKSKSTGCHTIFMCMPWVLCMCLYERNLQKLSLVSF